MPFDFETVDAGATAWVLASAALVLLMTPGLAFFYGGLVRSKNVLGMLMQNFVTIALVGIVWVLVGFSLAFGGDGNRFIGNFDFAGLQNMGETIPGYVDSFAQVIPPTVFVAFQMMFAIITVALITGATPTGGSSAPSCRSPCSGRCWSTRPVAHWVFSQGWAVRSAVRWTSPVAPWCTSTRVPRRWRWRSCSASRRGWPKEPDAAAQRAVRDARRGPAVVRLVRLQRRLRARRRRHSPASRSSTPRSPPARRCSPGSSWRGSATASRPRSARRPARWPAWSRSPRRLASSARSARSRSAWSPVALCALAVGLKYEARLRRLARRRRRPLRRRHRSARCASACSPPRDVNALGADGLFYGGGAGQLGKQALVVLVGLCLLAGRHLRHRLPDQPGHQATGCRQRPRTRASTLAEHGESAYELEHARRRVDRRRSRCPGLRADSGRA